MDAEHISWIGLPVVANKIQYINLNLVFRKTMTFFFSIGMLRRISRTFRFNWAFCILSNNVSPRETR